MMKMIMMMMMMMMVMMTMIMITMMMIMNGDEHDNDDVSAMMKMIMKMN